jgi:hypothetical protein
MKRSVLKPIAAGITLAALIFFLPIILASAMMFMAFMFIFFRFFLALRMRRAFAGKMQDGGTDGLRRENNMQNIDEGNQVIYLSLRNDK